MTKEDFNFINYFLQFYGFGGCYSYFFGDGIEREEVERALRVRKMFISPKFEGDTIDREIVRDICLHMRGEVKDNVAPWAR